ncbi:MAG: glycosyltransferase [Bacillota bacterium]|nr:glycosyltransferase [Bacillota bacterium]
MNDKRCIFHIPNMIDQFGTSGSQHRPRKMIDAFKNIGYKVDVVMGYGADRKKTINRIEENISHGVKYDFLYSESSTMPTLLTEKNHIPRYPFLDFGFFKKCRKNNIPVGLFYRDIYWKFDGYKKQVKGIEQKVALYEYEQDLRKYEKYVSRLYVPNMKMGEYIDNPVLDEIMDELPPGSILNNKIIEEKEAFYQNRKYNYDGTLRLFYVGAVGGHYECEKMFRGVSRLENVEMTVCCKEDYWDEHKDNLGKYVGNNISVIHKVSEELAPYYKQADICMAYFDSSEYMNMAMPIKVFEYLGNTIPVITNKESAAAEFIRLNDIGWNIEYDDNELEKLLKYLSVNYDEIVMKHKNAVMVSSKNTWEKRAEKVVKDLLEE